jgi:zinc protease
VIVTAAPDVTLPMLRDAIDAELARLMDQGPTADEMARSLAQAEAHFIYRLQTVGGFNGKSDQLNAYNVFIDDPGYFDADLERYRRLTIEDVKVAARRLVPAHRASLSVVPLGESRLALPDSNAAAVS